VCKNADTLANANIRFMKKLLILTLYLILSTSYVKAQNEKDSLYAISVDSIIAEKESKVLASEQLAFRDSLNRRNVFMGFDKGKLATIYFKGISCEKTTFYIHNDSLICVRYVIADPDSRSSLPPSTNYLIYFKNDQQVYNSQSTYWGGLKTCNTFSITQKDFLKEYYYYKSKIK
jgi:hypothetical protein